MIVWSWSKSCTNKSAERLKVWLHRAILLLCVKQREQLVQERCKFSTVEDLLYPEVTQSSHPASRISMQSSDDSSVCRDKLWEEKCPRKFNKKSWRRVAFWGSNWGGEVKCCCCRWDGDKYFKKKVEWGPCSGPVKAAVGLTALETLVRESENKTALKLKDPLVFLSPESSAVSTWASQKRVFTGQRKAQNVCGWNIYILSREGLQNKPQGTRTVFVKLHVTVRDTEDSKPQRERERAQESLTRPAPGFLGWCGQVSASGVW